MRPIWPRTLFLRAWDARQLERIQEPRAYLSTVARRLLCSLWRRRKLEQSYLDQLASLPPAFAPSAEDIALVREAIEAIDRVLEGLPSRVKRAFLLNRLDGMPQQNVLTGDLEFQEYQVQEGEVRSRGIELEGKSSFDNLDLIASLSYLDVFYTKSNYGNEGNRSEAQSPWAASVWADYPFTGQALAGVTL